MDAKGQGLNTQAVTLRELEQHALAWRAVALSARPADHPAAEDALRRAYRRAGVPCPGRIVWAPSPLVGAFACLLAYPGMARWDGRASRALADVDAAPVIEVARDLLARAGEGPCGRSVINDLFGLPMTEFLACLPLRTKDFWWHRANSVISASLQPELRALRDALWQAVGFATRFAVLPAWLGHHECQRLAAADFWTGVMGFRGRDRLEPLFELARSAGWVWPMAGLVIMTERPSSVSFDAGGRLHGESGPAVAYPDGFGLWACNGVRVPRKVIEVPATLTVAEIEAEPNTEVRRVMIDRFGPGRYLTESGARLIHEDSCGKLFRKPVPGAEPLAMVRVENSTPEPDGTHKVYWLRVPPGITRAKAAVAWTFGVPERAYHPGSQS